MRSLVVILTALCGLALGMEKSCGDWTALQPVKIGPGDNKCFTTSRGTQRCIMRYKKDGGCKEIKLTCSQFYLDNKDYAPICKDGDTMYVKADGRVKRFCGKQKNQLTNFPASLLKKGNESVVHSKC